MVEDREEAEPDLEQREEHGGGPGQHKLGSAVQTEWGETLHSMVQCVDRPWCGGCGRAAWRATEIAGAAWPDSGRHSDKASVARPGGPAAQATRCCQTSAASQQITPTILIPRHRPVPCSTKYRRPCWHARWQPAGYTLILSAQNYYKTLNPTFSILSLHVVISGRSSLSCCPARGLHNTGNSTPFKLLFYKPVLSQ